MNPGACGCGEADTDTDEDLTPDCNDECPADPNKVLAGACGCFNDGEGDEDNDGIPDCLDECNDDLDSDNDGTPDCSDACANDPNKTEQGQCVDVSLPIQTAMETRHQIASMNVTMMPTRRSPVSVAAVI